MLSGEISVTTKRNIRYVPGSKLGPAYPYSGWFSSVPPGEFRNSTLKLGHDRFIPNPFQFITFHLSPYYRRYIAYLLNKRRKMNYQPRLL
jgi:hypothetical protein